MRINLEKKSEGDHVVPVQQAVSGITQRRPLMDRRPTAIAQAKRQAFVNDSPQTKQLGTLQSMINSSPRVQKVAQKKTNPNGLPEQLKTGVENLSGIAMDDVRVHYNSPKPAQLQAYAYAQGTDIHLAPGQEKQLPHEAWHVVQQKQGRVRPTRQMKSKVALNDDPFLEKEADVMGTLANHADNRSKGKTLQQKTIAQSAGPTSDILVVQRKIGFEFEVGLPFGLPGEKVSSMFDDDYHNLKDPHLGPDVHIYDGTGFHVVEDHGGMEILGVESIVEYVIDAEEEYVDQERFLSNLRSAKAHIDKFSAAKQKPFPEGGKEYLLGGGQMQGAGARGVGQATFAVRMEGVTAMFDNKIKDDHFGGEDRVLFTTQILERAKLVAAETIELDCLKDLEEVKRIEGYLALAAQYLAANAISIEDAKILDKNRAPFLVRSQLSVIRDSTLMQASRTVLSNNLEVIYDKMIDVSRAKPEKAIIPHKGGPTAREWLRGALAGVDPPIEWGQSRVIAPEPVGSPGPAREIGGVVEQRHLKFGPITTSEWQATAIKVYEQTRKLNGIEA